MAISRAKSLTLVFLVVTLAASAAAKSAKHRARVRAAPPRPLAEGSIDDILARYTFVGDFRAKDPDRTIADEILWRYPLTAPKATFPIEFNVTDRRHEMPATVGDGRAVEHLNTGRQLFFEGMDLAAKGGDWTGALKKFDEAKATWLSARARYGKTYPFHRRDDYFIGYAFMNLAQATMKVKNQDLGYQDIRMTMSNAATFLSWAFILKEDEADPVVDAAAPKGLYNLAAIYWQYGRYAGAYGAASKGLDFLRRTGRKEYRPRFHRLLAESYIQNRSYLEAVQELDVAIRQDRDPKEAAASFIRAGDIYFDLNNFELADDAYALGARIDELLQLIDPVALVLRGESLFWLGRFSESQKILHFALEGPAYRQSLRPLPPAYASWAALRIADGFLARHDLDQARIEYYKVDHDYQGTLAGRIAKVRSACLELPYYHGKNVAHARELLEAAKVGPELPSLAKELAWSCQVASYARRDQTPEMLERVKTFAAAYPESRFLKSFIPPVRKFQAARIEPYFAAGDTYSALSFFEKNRKLLYAKVPKDLQVKLFSAYADIRRPKAASEFWDAYAATPASDLKVLRQAAVAAEMAGGAADQQGAKKGAKKITKKSAKRTPKQLAKVWKRRDQGFQKRLLGRAWSLAPDARATDYVMRILATPSAPQHLRWLLGLAGHFAATDPKDICDIEYPILSRLNQQGSREVVEKRLAEIIKAVMPGLFKHDESCAQSLLELEATHLREEPKVIADRYLARADWPLVGGYLHLYWVMAEHIYDAGQKLEARKMWQVIKDKGPESAPEVEFAKARLDPTRTELEKLWN